MYYAKIGGKGKISDLITELLDLFPLRPKVDRTNKYKESRSLLSLLFVKAVKEVFPEKRPRFWSYFKGQDSYLAG